MQGAMIALCIFLGAPSARAQVAGTSDDWFGRDKALHFGASAALATGGYAGASVFTETRPPRLAWGAGIALTAGIGKELWDLTGRGDPSWKDVAWNVAGTASGLLLSYAVDVLVRSLQRPASPASATP